MSLTSYPNYRPVEQESGWQIPVHWVTPPLYLRYCVELGKMLDTRRITGENLLPYLRNTDVQWDSINFDDLPEMDIDPREVNRYTLQKGDLLVCEGGEVGRAAVVDELPRPTAFQKALHRLRAKSDSEIPRYLFYVFSWAANAGMFSSNGQSTIAHLTGEQLRKLRFPCPPLSEQTAIANFLDRETAKIDALVTEQEELIHLLAEKHAATLSNAITRGIDSSEPRRDSGVTGLGEMPTHWDIKRLKFVATVQTGIAKGKDTTGKETITVPYLRVANVQDGFLALDDIADIDIEPEQLARYRLKPGDVLMNEGGDFDKLGRGAIWRGEIADCIHQNHVFAVRPFGILPEWLNRVTSSHYAQFYFMGRSKQSTNLASISSSNIMELPVPVPPADEQAAILRFIDDEAERLTALKAEAERGVALLRERRSALIAAAVTGQIDVRAVAHV